MRDCEEKAMERIRIAHEIAAAKGNALVVAYSGGKDSDVLLDLARRSGVPFKVEHNHTTADAPQTVYHIRRVFAELAALGIPCKINYPPYIKAANGGTERATMWNLIPKKLTPPTRILRCCCDFFKERRFDGRHLLFGVRRAESVQRSGRGVHETIHKKKKKQIAYTDESDRQIAFDGFADDNDENRKLTEICGAKNRVATNPIIDWYDDDVWRYARDRGLPMNPLYAIGFHRVGCIGCPMARAKTQLKEFALFPKYKDAYLRAFARMLDARREKGKPTDWRSPEDVFRWWIDTGHIVGQTEMELEHE